jgi:hypothetical protein
MLRAAPRRWSVGFVIRLAVVAVVFVVTAYIAVDLLVRAVGGIGYYQSSSSFTFSAPAPTLGDAGWAFLLGPGIQFAVAGLAAAVLWRRRPSWIGRLRAITWWLLALDVIVILVIYSAAEAAVI